MARKLKTYQTSIGFFDLAVAAPSMKAALEAWGSNSNLFHQGVASEVADPAVVAATMAKPGIVLRRPVGSSLPFKEHADLPRNLDNTIRPKKSAAKAPNRPSRKMDEKESRKAALAFERQQRQRESERRKEDAAQAKQREQRKQAVAKAQAVFDAAKLDHDKKARLFENQRAAIEKRSQAEESRWEKQKAKLEIALRQARGG